MHQAISFTVTVCQLWSIKLVAQLNSPAVCWCIRYNSRTRTLENLVLQQGLDLPAMVMSSDEPLPPPRTLLDEPPTVAGAEHSYSLPPDTSGEAARLQRRRPKADPVWRPLVAKTNLPADHSITGTAVLSAPEPVGFSVVTIDVSQGVPVATLPAVEVPTAGLPKTTAWRHRKNLERGSHQFTRNEKHTPVENVGNPALQQRGIQNTGHSHFVQIWGKQGRSGWLKLKIWFLVDSK